MVWMWLSASQVMTPSPMEARVVRRFCSDWKSSSARRCWRSRAVRKATETVWRRERVKRPRPMPVKSARPTRASMISRNLTVPEGDALGPALCGGLEHDAEAGADGIHLCLAHEVEGEVGGVAAGGDHGDEGIGEGDMPGLVQLDEFVEVGVRGRAGCGDGLELVDGFLHDGVGVAIGLEKAGVVGGLVAAEAGFFVDDEPVEQGDERDAVVGLFEQGRRWRWRRETAR